MQTEVLSKIDLKRALCFLKQKELVVFPTETVYGLGALLFEEEAVKKVFEVKKRPVDNPLIAHISHLEQVYDLAKELPEAFFILAKAFWPGPLTIVVKKQERVPSIVSAFLPGVAVRMPSHPVAQELISFAKEPLVAPSANLSGRPSPTCVEDVLEDLDGKIKAVIEGGKCQIGIESTVISLIKEKPVLLRPGSITKSSIEFVLGQKVLSPQEKEPVMSPGMKYRHYAPQAEVELVFDEKDLEGPFFKPTRETLYSELRKADRKNLKKIQVYCDEDLLLDEALMNRLLRASEKK